MLQSKRGNFIVALILAVALWMYVVGETDPEISKTFRQVPVTVTNEQTLADSGLAFTDISSDYLSVTLTGRRSDISSVKITDITAVVDLSEAVRGDNQLRVVLRAPSDVEVTDQEYSRLTVKVENRRSEEKPVKVEYTEGYSDDNMPVTIGIDPEEIKVSGGENAVGQVKALKATINYEDVTDSPSALGVGLTPVDGSGKEISHVELAREKANITSVMYQKKMVPLSVEAKGRTGEKYEREIEVPENIEIVGAADEVSKIRQIKTEQIDLEDVNEDTKIDAKLILPDDIKTVDDKDKVTVEVKVRKRS